MNDETETWMSITKYDQHTTYVHLSKSSNMILLFWEINDTEQHKIKRYWYFHITRFKNLSEGLLPGGKDEQSVSGGPLCGVKQTKF